VIYFRGELQLGPENLRNDRSRDPGVTANVRDGGKTWQSNSRSSCGQCAPPAETPEISRRFDSQLLATSFENLELTKFPQDSCKCILISDALKSLAKNQLRQSKTLRTELSIKVIGLFVPQAAQIVGPDRTINDDHRSPTLQVTRDEPCEGLHSRLELGRVPVVPVYGSVLLVRVRL